MCLSKYKSRLSSSKQKVLSNIAWAIGGKIINLLGVLFVGILVARYLGPEQFGLMNYVISYVSLFTVISSFGLEDIEIRELSKHHERKDFILGTAFRLRLTFATIAYLLIIFALWAFKTDLFTTLMILVYSITLFTSCFNVIRNYFTSIIENKYIVKTEIARTLIGAFIKIVLLWFKAPLSLFIIATAFDTILVGGGYIISYRNKVGKLKDWKYDRSIVSFLIKESFPLVLSGTAIVIYQRIDQVMIGNMIDNKSVGYFATAGKFLDLILFLPMILTQTVTPLLIRKREGDIVEYEKMKQLFVNVVVWFSIVLSSFVSIGAYWLVDLTFGKEYLAAVPVLQIMAWKTVGMALSASSGQIIIMEGIQKWAVIRNLIGTVICVGLNLVLIPRWGIVGSAWVTVITMLSSSYLAHYLIPPYRALADIQLYALFNGWKDIFKVKIFIKKSI